MQTRLPKIKPEDLPGLAAGAALGSTPPRCCLLTVWSTGEAGFASRALLLAAADKSRSQYDAS